MHISPSRLTMDRNLPKIAFMAWERIKCRQYNFKEGVVVLIASSSSTSLSGNLQNPQSLYSVLPFFLSITLRYFKYGNQYLQLFPSLVP